MRDGRASVVMATALIAARLMVSGAVGHGWYPRECCHNIDCAPVERVEPLADGSLRVTSRVGTTVVPTGQVLTYVASSGSAQWGLDNRAAGFVGYVITQAAFQYCHAFASSGSSFASIARGYLGVVAK